MNESSDENSLISEKNPSSVSQQDEPATSNSRTSNDEPAPPRSTYESFSWLLNYSRMFATRLARDVFISLLGYCYNDSDVLLPDHIIDLMRVQKSLRSERESHAITYSSSRERHRFSSLRISMRKYYNAFKSYILSSEDESGFQYTPTKDYESVPVDREPMFVIVDSSCASNPSSKELLIDSKNYKNDAILRRYFNKHIKPVDVPSTSRDHTHDIDIISPQLKESESREELQMIDINLQSENEILLGEGEIDNDSIVISYLRNRDAFFDVEDLSDSFLDVHIPSYPGSPRSLLLGSRTSIFSRDERDVNFRKAIDFLHEDHEFLIAAETGDEEMLQTIISKGTDIQQRDHLGRNALHLAVCSDNMRMITTLLTLGVNPNVKDSVGMTPLSLSLMRRPSLKVAMLLFDFGAVIIPRATPMDTGLFLQFVMMSIPTREEEKILHLLVDKGALVNDPEAPGGRQALHFAAMSNNCDLIEILVELGADLYVTNHRNETPKEVALTFKCREAFQLLEELEDNPLSLESGNSNIQQSTLSVQSRQSRQSRRSSRQSTTIQMESINDVQNRQSY